jgi:alanine dehydrogenase
LDGKIEDLQKQIITSIQEAFDSNEIIKKAKQFFEVEYQKIQETQLWVKAEVHRFKDYDSKINKELVVKP